ncbi:unnamed protein product [Adineta ricciae]|uniref:Uncharacterized protein n=1 Tax=Adineta ricciae TaxID=249248 RepID=A0A814KGJ7_ADIRI|nr:unnamed protein product [Adineta ricciae]CAF1209120.1 unnamed protein product [Adineta ricciae]
MYAPPPAVAAGGARRSGLAASGPLLAICCLLFILFLIASTIVLALIPVYLSTRDSNSSTYSPTYLMTMTPTNGSFGGEGTLSSDSLSTIASASETATGIPSGSFSVNSGTSTANSSGRRKRRGFGLIRHRRAISIVYCPFAFNRKRCGARCDGSAFRAKIKTFTIIVTVIVSGTTYTNVIFTVVITYSSNYVIPTPSSSTGSVVG